MNMRIVAFILIIGGLVGALTYPFIHSAVTRGIEAQSDGSLKIDLQHISLFEFDPMNGKLEDVPADFRKLDGKRVEFYAEIAPPTFGPKTDPKAFELVFSVAKCCMTTSPKVQHFVQTRMADNGKFESSGGQVRVRGIFHVKITHDADTGKANGIYHFDCDQMEPA